MLHEYPWLNVADFGGASSSRGAYRPRTYRAELGQEHGHASDDASESFDTDAVVEHEPEALPVDRAMEELAALREEWEVEDLSFGVH